MARRSGKDDDGYPVYKHLVWNRTDLTQSAGNLTVAYDAAQPPLLNEAFPPKGYQGETIPPYAVMRVLTRAVWYKKRWCFPVCRPDDNSMTDQTRGMHFINGPSPIPFTLDSKGNPNGYGMATNDLPAPALVDMTVDHGNLPYGNTSTTGADEMGLLLGYVSGCWALHPAGDILLGQGILPSGMLNIGNVTVPGGSVSMLASTLPYVSMGFLPLGVKRPLPPTALDPNSSPTLAFDYSKQVMLVSDGALGFGSVSGVGF